MDSIESDSRFDLSKNSIQIAVDLRSFLYDLQNQEPKVKGMTLFGSRVIGAEKEDSDLDVVIYYDGSEFNDALPPRSHGDKDEKIRTLTRDEAFANIQRRLPRIQFEHNVTGQMHAEMKKLGAQPKGYSFSSKSVITIDMSSEALNEHIANFERLIDSSEDLDAIETNSITQNAFPIASLFFLAACNSIYAYRKIVLDHFRSKERGEEYFACLMKILSNIERRPEHPRYNRYPQTIEDASKYFRIDIE